MAREAKVEPKVVTTAADLSEFAPFVMDEVEQWNLDVLSGLLSRAGFEQSDVEMVLAIDATTATALLSGAFHATETAGGNIVRIPDVLLSTKARSIRDSFDRLLTAAVARAVIPGRLAPKAIDASDFTWGVIDAAHVEYVRNALNGVSESTDDLWRKLPDHDRSTLALSVAHISLNSWREALGVDVNTMARYLRASRTELQQSGDYGTKEFTNFLRSMAVLREAGHSSEWSKADLVRERPRYSEFNYPTYDEVVQVKDDRRAAAERMAA